jgi:hypothetical protein
MFLSDCLSMYWRFVLRGGPLLAIIILCGASGWAIAEETPPRPIIGADNANLTGETFLKALTASPEESERAGIYLLGVSDAGERKAWCDHRTVKTITVKEFVFEYFKKLPVARLQERAAPLIEEALRASFPCGRSK